MYQEQGRSMGRDRGSAPSPHPLVLCPKKSKHARLKVEYKKIISQGIETIMSLQLGETFFGCKIPRPVQWVLRTENSLLFKHNEVPKIFLHPPPPPVSKGLPRPCKSE